MDVGEVDAPVELLLSDPSHIWNPHVLGAETRHEEHCALFVHALCCAERLF